MQIEYTLLETKRGHLNTRTPFTLEHGNLTIVFNGESVSGYTARLSDKRGVFCTKEITESNNIVIAATKLKSGNVNLELVGEDTRFVCEPFCVRSLGSQLQREFEVSPAYDKLAERVDDIEETIATITANQKKLWEAMQAITDSNIQTQELIESLINAYNNPMG